MPVQRLIGGMLSTGLASSWPATRGRTNFMPSILIRKYKTVTGHLA